MPGSKTLPGGAIPRSAETSRRSNRVKGITPSDPGTEDPESILRGARRGRARGDAPEAIRKLSNIRKRGVVRPPRRTTPEDVGERPNVIGMVLESPPGPAPGRTSGRDSATRPEGMVDAVGNGSVMSAIRGRVETIRGSIPSTIKRESEDHEDGDDKGRMWERIRATGGSASVKKEPIESISPKNTAPRPDTLRSPISTAVGAAHGASRPRPVSQDRDTSGSTQQTPILSQNEKSQRVAAGSQDLGGSSNVAGLRTDSERENYVRDLLSKVNVPTTRGDEGSDSSSDLRKVISNAAADQGQTKAESKQVTIEGIVPGSDGTEASRSKAGADSPSTRHGGPQSTFPGLGYGSSHPSSESQTFPTGLWSSSSGAVAESRTRASQPIRQYDPTTDWKVIEGPIRDTPRPSSAQEPHTSMIGYSDHEDDSLPPLEADASLATTLHERPGSHNGLTSGNTGDDPSGNTETHLASDHDIPLANEDAGEYDPELFGPNSSEVDDLPDYEDSE